MSEDIPTVCFIADICRILRVSRTTVTRMRRHGSFPIRELDSIDKHPRWAGEDVRRYLEHKDASLRRRVG